MKIKYDRFYYNPLPEELVIKDSSIHGHGIFAKCNLPEKYDLGMSHIKIPIIHGYVRTPLGGFLNHDDQPNCSLFVDLDWDDYLVYKVMTIKKIKKGTELLLKYGS
tara:strand:+ start:21 stop:338 length:318 start_codon:yes stop_codon:yes gene_type:complete